MAQHRKLIVLALLCGVSLSACVAPARTYKPYEADALTTAEEMQSAVQTALLASSIAGRDRAFGNYLSAVFGDTEDTAAAVQSNFDSEQPPGHLADQLRSDLDQLLQNASSILVDLRIHARRGQISQLNAMARPLQKVADHLDAFIKAHD